MNLQLGGQGQAKTWLIFFNTTKSIGNRLLGVFAIPAMVALIDVGPSLAQAQNQKQGM